MLHGEPKGHIAPESAIDSPLAHKSLTTRHLWIKTGKPLSDEIVLAIGWNSEAKALFTYAKFSAENWVFIDNLMPLLLYFRAHTVPI